MARDTWDSRMGAKVNFSQLFSISAREWATPLAAEGLTARSFLRSLMPLVGPVEATGMSKVAAGGDMLGRSYSRGLGV